MAGERIRVMLVDDHALLRAGLRSLLAQADDMVVVGEAKDGNEALALVEGYAPDVVVMDLDMASMDGIDATREMIKRKPSRRILILTMHAEEDYLVTLLEAGATGYLVKSVADAELLDAVRTVATGELYVRANAARILAQNLVRPDHNISERSQFESLTPREQDVLRLTAQGYTAPEIGDRLSISPKTVDTYKQRLKEKLGLAHRSDYVRLALRLDLLGS